MSATKPKKWTPPHESLDRYLVISYDHDVPQIMLDYVIARSPDVAAEIVLKLRPYVQHAEALTVEDVRYWQRSLESENDREIKKGLIDIALESREETILWLKEVDGDVLVYEQSHATNNKACILMFPKGNPHQPKRGCKTVTVHDVPHPCRWMS